MNNQVGSYRNQISFIEAVRDFDSMTKRQCPKLIKYMGTVKGKNHVLKVFNDVGGTCIPQHINAGTDVVTVMMAYFTVDALQTMFATFPVNELQAQTLQSTPFNNNICEAFRQFRFDIKL